MRMLDDLRDVLEEIAAQSDWEHRFVQDILIRKEECPEIKLTGAQFNKLVEIHNKYCRDERI